MGQRLGGLAGFPTQPGWGCGQALGSLTPSHRMPKWKRTLLLLGGSSLVRHSEPPKRGVGSVSLPHREDGGGFLYPTAAHRRRSDVS